MPILRIFLLMCMCLPAYAKTMHVFLALCDINNQLLKGVPKSIGNGMDEKSNLYWGCTEGLKTFFIRSGKYDLLYSKKNFSTDIIERAVFKRKSSDIYIVADAFYGHKIDAAIIRLVESSAGVYKDSVVLNNGSTVNCGNDSDIVCYVGHNLFMDFHTELGKKIWAYYNNSVPSFIEGSRNQNVILLSCSTFGVFKSILQKTKAYPLLWTKQKLSAEAYTLDGFIDGWELNKENEELRMHAIKAYAKYQNASIKGVSEIFITGWYNP